MTFHTVIPSEDDLHRPFVTCWNSPPELVTPVVEHLGYDPQRQLSSSPVHPGPIRIIVNPIRDIIHRALTSITSRYAIIISHGRGPPFGKSGIDGDGVRVEHEYISPGGVFGPVVVCAIENQGDWVVWVEGPDGVPD